MLCLERQRGAPLLRLLQPTGTLCVFPLNNRQSVSIIRLGLDFSLLPLKFLLTSPPQIVGVCSNTLPANGLCCPLPSRKIKGLKNGDAAEVLGIGFPKRCRISFRIIFRRCIIFFIIIIWSTIVRKKRFK